MLYLLLIALSFIDCIIINIRDYLIYFFDISRYIFNLKKFILLLVIYANEIISAIEEASKT